MPVYFFDIFGGDELVRDEEGQECASLADAEHEAEESARELAAIAITRRDAIDAREVRVRDSTGAVVFTISLREIVAT